MKLPEHFEKIRDEMAKIAGTGAPMAGIGYVQGFDACYAHMMPLLEQAIHALEYIRLHKKADRGFIEAQCEQTLTSLKQKLGKESQP